MFVVISKPGDFISQDKDVDLEPSSKPTHQENSYIQIFFPLFGQLCFCMFSPITLPLFEFKSFSPELPFRTSQPCLNQHSCRYHMLSVQSHSVSMDRIYWRPCSSSGRLWEGDASNDESQRSYRQEVPDKGTSSDNFQL